MSLLAATTVLVLAAFLSAKALPRVPQPIRHEIARTGRALRLSAGGYSLKTVMGSMIDEMLGSALPSITRSYLPANMHFGLHPVDTKRWGDCFPELARELEELMLAEIGKRADLELKGDLRVTIVEDNAARPGRPTFCADMGRPEPAPALRVTRPVPPSVAGPATATRRGDRTKPARTGDTTSASRAQSDKTWCLAITGHAPVTLVDALTVGRGDTAGLHIENDDLSRVHARFDVAGEGVTLVDLGSTNGTWLNGERISVAAVTAGDVVGFGRHVYATLQRSTGAEQPRRRSDGAGRSTRVASNGFHA